MTDKEYIKLLKEKDTPMPMKQWKFTSEKFKNNPPIDLCGRCESALGIIEKYCGECGQKIDRENYQL